MAMGAAGGHFRWGAIVLALVGAGGCYQVPAFEGPYRCLADGGCGSGDLRCDDGLCCQPLGTPQCRTLVLEDGSCANGTTPLTWFLDRDRDGYGDSNTGQLKCDKPYYLPPGAETGQWIERGGDCNDLDPSAFPLAAEACDGKDNDCDGEVDEGAGARPWWPDQDGDGFGDDAGMPVVRCPRIPPYTAELATDCDDQDNTVNPSVTEVCNGRDDNCNGAIDESDPAAGMGCNTGGMGICALGARTCVDGSLACVAPPSRAESCNGLDDDCDGTSDEGVSGCLLGIGASHGAKDLKLRTAGADQNACLKPLNPPGATPVFTPFDGHLWQGNGLYTQFAYAENLSGGTWNMTGDYLDIAFTAQINDPAAGVWSAASFPVVLLCADDGTYARYVFIGGGQWQGKGPTVNFRETVPLGLAQGKSDGGWYQSEAAPPVGRVRRVEIILETDALDAGFTVEFKNLRFHP